MKADPFAQLKLLDVQALDLKADTLRHQRAHLPETAELATLDAARETKVNQVRDAQIVVDDLTAAQRKADRDVEQVKTRRTRDRDRMDQGLITNPKDLARMQTELESLERRITVLEDEELEVMEQLEAAQTALDEATASLAEDEARAAELTARRDERFAEIDQELAGVVAAREPEVAELPEDLLALYEKLRANKGGIGAAELRARQCGGCRLTLDAAELAQIRNTTSDTVVRCEECQRILVRTAESGL